MAQREYDGDETERAEFEALLEKSSVKTIQKALDREVINRAWKRDRAKAVIANRTRAPGGGATKPGTTRPGAGNVWPIVIAIILAALGFIAISVLGL